MTNRIKNLMKNNPLISKLISGMIWSILGTVISKIFIMIASIVTARLLGTDKNGEYGIINSTVLMFSTFAGLGLGTTATRFVSEYKTKDVERSGRIIGMTYLVGMLSGFIMAIILFVLSPWLARKILNTPHLITGLRLSSILLITNTINTIQQNTLSGFERFKDIAKISIIIGMVSLPIFLIFTYLFSVNGLVLGHIIISGFTMILYIAKEKKVRNEYNVKIDLKRAYKEIDIMWKFSIPSLLSNIMVGPIVWIGNTLITSIPKGYSELGIFNAANQWRTLLTFIPTTVGNVILPLIIANKGKDRLERINILLGWIIVLCISIPLLSAPEIITILYGKEYIGDTFNVSLILIVLISCILSYKEGISRNLVSNNLMWWGFLSNTIWGISFLLVLLFIYNLGAIGLALSYTAAYIISTIIFVPFYIKNGVVHRTLIISNKIIMMWITLIIQIFITIFYPEAILLRLLTFIISMYALWVVIRTMITKEKLI